MAIDRTGISSLDTGASDITYSGNEGPKSPQEEQQMMLAQLKEEYEQYKMEQIEIDPSKVLSFQDWYQATYEASRQGVAEGGIARLGYIHGGITHPDGRRGFFMGAEKDARESGKSMSPGTRADYSPGQGHRETYGAPPGITTTPTHVPKPPEDKDDGDNWLKKQLEARAKTAYNLVPNKFSWTYDKRKRFIASLSDPEKRALGYNFNVDWDDLDDEEKDRLMSYDVYRDLNEAGYQGWLDKDYEEKFGKPGGGKGGQTLPYYPPDVHPGTGGITDATDATGTTSDWNVASLDQPFDRSTSEHDFSSQYFYGADGGRARYAGGGITDLRQAYGLGKLVKKIGKTFKKAAKSPLGKAALAFAAYKFGPQLLSGKGFGLGDVKTWGGLNWANKLDAAGKVIPGMERNVNLARMIGIPSLAGYLTTEEEEEGEGKGYEEWLAKKNAWLGRIGDFPTTPVDPLYQRNLMAADGGRIGYDSGGLSSLDFVDKIYSDEARALAGNMPEIRKHGSQYAPTLFEERTDTGEWKYPGEPREGQEYLTSTLQGANTILDKMEMKKQRLKELAKEKGLDFDDIFKMELDRIYDIEGPATKKITKIKDRERILDDMEFKLTENLYAKGGRIGYQGGGYNDEDEEEGHRSAALSAMYGLRKNAQEGGLMDLGGMEKDYREEGGFVPIGGQERADDVPARLSKNEFVFTADAVRAAGGGDIDAGAEVMENVMNNLEQGGNISEESQGLEGARDMFATSQRLEGVM